MGALAWFRRHWKAILGGILFIPSILRGLRFALDFGGYIDFALAHMTQPGWLGVVIAYFIDPPPGIILPLILCGLGLIYWDTRRVAVRTTAPRIRADINLSNGQMAEQCESLSNEITQFVFEREYAAPPFFNQSDTMNEDKEESFRRFAESSDYRTKTSELFTLKFSRRLSSLTYSLRQAGHVLPEHLLWGAESRSKPLTVILTIYAKKLRAGERINETDADLRNRGFMP